MPYDGCSDSPGGSGGKEGGGHGGGGKGGGGKGGGGKGGGDGKGAQAASDDVLHDMTSCSAQTVHLYLRLSLLGL